MEQVLPRNDNKESMSVNVSPAKFTTNEGVKQNVRTTFQARSNQTSTLREMQGKCIPSWILTFLKYLMNCLS